MVIQIDCPLNFRAVNVNVLPSIWMAVLKHCEHGPPILSSNYSDTCIHVMIHLIGSFLQYAQQYCRSSDVTSIMDKQSIHSPNLILLLLVIIKRHLFIV